MILDKKRNEVYRDLEDWLECNCPAEDCQSCPISSYKNGKGSLCGDFMRDFPERVLELLKDRIVEVQNEAEVKKEMEKMNKAENETENQMENQKENQMKTKETIPPLCRILGVRPYQEFHYEDDESWIFAINENGVRYRKEGGDWTVSYNEENLVKLIQHPEKVVPGEESLVLRYICRTNGMVKTLKKFLPTTQSVEEMNGKFFVLVDASDGTPRLVEINIEAWEALEE